MCMLPYSCRCNDENGSPILINDRLRTNPFIFKHSLMQHPTCTMPMNAASCAQ